MGPGAATRSVRMTVPSRRTHGLTLELTDDLRAEHAHKLADTLRPWRAKHPDLRVDEQVRVLGRPAFHLIHAAATALAEAAPRGRGAVLRGQAVSPSSSRMPW